MSTVYNPEADIRADIERLELETREIRKRIEHAHAAADRKVLNQQLAELENQIQQLQIRLT